MILISTLHFKFNKLIFFLETATKKSNKIERSAPRGVACNKIMAALPWQRLVKFYCSRPRPVSRSNGYFAKAILDYRSFYFNLHLSLATFMLDFIWDFVWGWLWFCWIFTLRSLEVKAHSSNRDIWYRENTSIDHQFIELAY